MVHRVTAISILAVLLLAAQVFAEVKVGDKAPTFTLDNIDGKSTVKLSDLTTKPTILVFWFNACSHCRNEAPVLQKLYADLRDKINVVGVSADVQRTVAAEFVRKYGLTYPNAYVGQGKGREVLSDYGITAVPVVLVIGKDGRVKARYIGEVKEPTLREDLGKLGVR